MNERVWFAALVYPAPLYVGYLVLHQMWGGSLAFLLGFLVTLGFGTATAVGVVRPPAAVAAGRVVLALLAVPFFAEFGLGPAGVDLSAGILLGAPFVWLEYVWHAGARPGERILALQATFCLGVVCLASATAAGSSVGGLAFFRGLTQALANQVQGLYAVLTGGPTSSMPLESALSTGYVALGALAIVGALLSWFVPQTALEEPLPWSWARARPSVSAPAVPGEELGLRDGQREALASRTLPTPPEAAVAPGFSSFVAAAMAVVGFVALAVAAPTYALGVLLLGIAAAVVLVGVVLSRRLTPLGGLEG